VQILADRLHRPVRDIPDFRLEAPPLGDLGLQFAIGLAKFPRQHAHEPFLLPLAPAHLLHEEGRLDRGGHLHAQGLVGLRVPAAALNEDVAERLVLADKGLEEPAGAPPGDPELRRKEALRGEYEPIDADGGRGRLNPEGAYFKNRGISSKIVGLNIGGTGVPTSLILSTEFSCNIKSLAPVNGTRLFISISVKNLNS